MKLLFWGGLGDEIAITGLVRELKRRWPKEQIIVENNRYPELFHHNPHLDGGTDSGRVVQLQPAPNDQIGNFVHAYAQLAGLTHIASAEPELHLTSLEREATLAMLAPGTKPMVAIDTWAAWPRRRWPFERFAEVTKTLTTRGFRVIEVGTSHPDLVTGERRTQRLPIDPVDCFLEILNVRETAALLSHCVAYIGNDSGVAHLAAAVKTPAVVLYTVPWYARAYRTTYPVFSLQHDCLGCEQKCINLSSSCLLSITPELVLDVFDTIDGLPSPVA